MKTSVLRMAAAAPLLLLMASGSLHSASYPDRPITLVIPLSPGGSHDLHARGITPELSKLLGQPVVVKFLPGGAGMKGTGFAAEAKPDGYTILFTHNYFDQMVPQTQKVPFDALKSFNTLARINYSQPMFMTRPGTPFKDLKGVVAHAKANPGKVTFGHSGVWGVMHTPMLQFIKAANIKVNFIPHKGGGPVLRALLASQDDVGGVFATQARPHFKAGKVIPLVVVGEKRIEGDPDFGGVPSMTELGYPTVTSTMDRIFMAPAGMAPDRLNKLRAAFDGLVKQQAVKDYIKNLGDEIKYMNGADYDALRPAKYETFTVLIKEMTAK
ncbi:MAG: tripartite tricarboxylate transporter substrate binding protein [Betaproteobacteria bacterium]|nr:MAG: tripartite tricarboxylate transporter substrate binding protein [Betaproteobacteria bacterium]